MHWNAEVRETFLKELAKLERTHPQSPVTVFRQLPSNHAKPSVGSLYDRQSEFKECRRH